ncbi:MAG TPA: hypothetical protein VLU06_09295, partial [Thermoanaerobaculia bacterium]|nr:hypothetical protein [Thermoanaerobaculia bacterium]
LRERGKDYVRHRSESFGPLREPNAGRHREGENGGEYKGCSGHLVCGLWDGMFSHWSTLAHLA